MGLPHYIHILEILWPDILVPKQRPSTSSLTIVLTIPSGFVRKWSTPECLMLYHQFPNQSWMFGVSPLFGHTQICMYIYTVYIYITWYPHYIRWSSHLWWAKIKAHSVSMAVRTSKDVAGGCWTAAGTRHCLEQLALLRYKDHQLSLPMKITNIHKQCVKPC